MQEEYSQHRLGSEGRPQCTSALPLGSAPEGTQHVTRAGQETLVSYPSREEFGASQPDLCSKENRAFAGRASRPDLCNKGNSAFTGTDKTPQGIFRAQS